VVRGIGQQIVRHVLARLAEAYVLELDPEFFSMRREQLKILADWSEVVFILPFLEKAPRVDDLRAFDVSVFEKGLRVLDAVPVAAEEHIVMNGFVHRCAGKGRNNSESQNQTAH